MWNNFALCVFIVQFQFIIVSNAEGFATQGQGTLDWSPRPCTPKNISYIVGTQKVNWFQAFVICKQNQMELAAIRVSGFTISSKQEQTAIEQYLRTTNPKGGFYDGYWLGGTRNGACSTDFVWFTTGKPVIFRKFALGQPDQAVEACLQMLLDGANKFVWNDIDCNAKLNFICQTLHPSANTALSDDSCA